MNKRRTFYLLVILACLLSWSGPPAGTAAAPDQPADPETGFRLPSRPTQTHSEARLPVRYPPHSALPAAVSPAAPLADDPLYSWHTFYGNLYENGFDFSGGTAVDGSGNVYGAAASGNWLGDGGAQPLHPHSGGDFDIDVLKLSSSGAYQWHTFYGSGGDYANQIRLDADGNIYLAGFSVDSWLGDGGTQPLHPHSGGGDIYVLKLDNNGAYQWHTFYGSSIHDLSMGMVLDSNGNVYLSGKSSASWLGDGGAVPLHAHSGSGDITVVKLDSSGAYQWHTFYGSSASDFGQNISIDSSNRVNVAGWSYGSWVGDGGATPLHAYSGDADIAVLQLNSSGAYQWHTFYGLTDYDAAYGIAVDGIGNIYVHAESIDSWLGDGSAPPLHPHSAGVNVDMTTLKLDSSGAYQWHTFYGSIEEEWAANITLDAAGNLYAVGRTPADWLGDGDTPPLHAHSGSYDNTVIKLDNSGVYQWHTFYGPEFSSEGSMAYGVVVDGSSVYVGASATYSWLGDGDTPPLHAHSGWEDMGVLKLDTAGAYQWHTFYGGLGNEAGFNSATRLDADEQGNLYIAGGSGGWLAEGNAPPLHAYNGTLDVLGLKLDSSGAYQWHTFYGSGNMDGIWGGMRDSSGNVYVLGYSLLNWLGDGGTPPVHPHLYPGEWTLTILKLDSAGAYQWHSFYGPANYAPLIAGAAVYPDGNVYMIFDSIVSWLGDVGEAPLQHFIWGNSDIVIIKLDSSGAYQWHTFYGSSGNDQGSEIALGANGMIYVTGSSAASWLGDGGAAPLHVFTTPGPDISVIQLDAAGAYQWHTFYGSGSNNLALASDAGSNLYLTGRSTSNWDVDGAQPLHAHSSGSSNDLAVLKLNSAGAYQWHTFYGGTQYDGAMEIVYEEETGLYVAAYSRSAWLGDGEVAPVHAHSGAEDMTLLHLDTDGAYQWHTFYGSDDVDQGVGLVVDSSQRVTLSGASYAAWNGPGGEAPLHAHSGDMDVVIVQLDPLMDVSVAKSGTGSGMVTSSPPGIDCGSDCSDTVDYGSTITLTATPDINSTFAGWSGACSGMGDCIWRADGPQQITATFMIKNYILDVDVTGAGSGAVSSQPPGIDCGADCSEVFVYGTIVTLTAAAETGSTFAGWGGACTGTQTCVVTIDQAQQVSADFTLEAYEVSVSLDGVGSGGVSSDPPGITCDSAGGGWPTACSANFDYGTLLTLTASADTGSTFAGWGGVCSGMEACQFIVIQPRQATATFNLDAYELSVSLGGTGSGAVTSSPPGIACDTSVGADCAEAFAYGAAVTLTAAADTGSTFTGWGGACTGTGSCAVSMHQAQQVTAEFTLNTYELSISLIGDGSGTVTSQPPGITCTGVDADCSEVFNHGTVVTLTAVISTGSTFTAWGGACSGVDICVVVIDQAQNVTASFQRQPQGPEHSLFLPLVNKSVPPAARSESGLILPRGCCRQ